MYHYLLFGGVLRSEIEIPEPRWTLHCTDAPVPDADGEHLGSDKVTGEVEVHMHRRPAGGFRMRFDDTGVFDMRTNTATITGNVVISQGPNIMRAEKLVVDMKTGFSRMEAGSKDGNKRVQGLFLPSSMDSKNAPQRK